MRLARIATSVADGLYVNCSHRHRGTRVTNPPAENKDGQRRRRRMPDCCPCPRAEVRADQRQLAFLSQPSVEPQRRAQEAAAPSLRRASCRYSRRSRRSTLTTLDDLQTALEGLSTERLEPLVDRLEQDPDVKVTVGAWLSRCPMVIAGFDPASAQADRPEHRFALVWDHFARSERRLWMPLRIRRTYRPALRRATPAS